MPLLSRAVQPCLGTTLNQWLQLDLVVWFGLISCSLCSPDGIPEVRGDASAVFPGSSTDLAARDEGARLSAHGSSAGQQEQTCHRFCRAGALRLLMRLMCFLPDAAQQKWQQNTE